MSLCQHFAIVTYKTARHNIAHHHRQMPSNSQWRILSRDQLGYVASLWSQQAAVNTDASAHSSSSWCHNNLKSHSSVSEFKSRVTVRGARSGNSELFSPVSHHVMISPLPCNTHAFMNLWYVINKYWFQHCTINNWVLVLEHCQQTYKIH